MTDASELLLPRWRRALGSPWLHLIAAFVVAGLLLLFIVKPYWVPSGSMEQTLEPGDRILVNRLAYVGAGPSTGDVIVFDAGAAWGEPSAASANPLRWAGEVTGFGPSGPHTLVKRVIGAAGQTVECCSADGRVVVDGVPLDEPYVTNDFAYETGRIDCDTTPRSPRCFDPVLIPADSYLVLGDNRASSSDSAAHCRTEHPDAACWRWAARDGIVGRAMVVVWPISHWAGL